MIGAKFSLEGLSPERPPVVVMGDLTLVRPHGMAGIPVILATRDPHDIALRSRYVHGACVLPPVPSGAAAEEGGQAAAEVEAVRWRTAEVLLDTGARLHRALGRKVPLVYGSDKDLELIYLHRRALGEHYAFVLNDEELAWGMLDKEQFSTICEAAGVRAPRTLRPGEGLGALEAMREPLLVKPRRKTSWKDIQRDLFEGKGKARVFPTRSALLSHPAFARFRDELIIQEHIGGGVGDLVSFHAFADEEGQLLASFCGRKVRTYPAFAGESSLIELTTDAEVDAAGRDIAARLGLKGPFKIDLIRDAESGELYTLEINARYTLWHYLGAVSGVNLPVVAYDLLVHGQRPQLEPRPAPRYRWLNLYRDWMAFREQREDGSLRLRDWLRSVTSPATVYEAFSWQDPGPFAWWAGGQVVRKVANGALRDRVGHPR